MRYRLTLVVAVAALSAGIVFAEQGNQNMAGCGLGSQLFKESNRGSQISASTTNQSSGQIYAITTGTSGCSARPGFESRLQRQRFIAANYRSLSRELAAGSGEYAVSLSTVMGCQSGSAPRFLSMAKERYDRLFPAQGSNPEQLMKALETAISADTGLAQRCSL